jgi:FdrA protein
MPLQPAFVLPSFRKWQVDMNEKEKNILNEELQVINLGLPQFAQSLEQQEVDVVHILWTPPAGGDQEMIDLLDQLL